MLTVNVNVNVNGRAESRRQRKWPLPCRWPITVMFTFTLTVNILYRESCYNLPNERIFLNLELCVTRSEDYATVYLPVCYRMYFFLKSIIGLRLLVSFYMNLVILRRWRRLRTFNACDSNF